MKFHNFTLRLIAIASTAIASCLLPRSAGAVPLPSIPVTELDNPYDGIDWETVEVIDSFSHQHGTDFELMWEMGYRHLPLSNYYPSKPTYPLPDTFLEKHPDALGGRNAEQHSTTDRGGHFNSLGSYYTTGYGARASIQPNTADTEYRFEKLNVYDADHAPWEGIYRLDFRIEAVKGASAPALARITIQGATEVQANDFIPSEAPVLNRREITLDSPKSIFLKAESDHISVRVEIDPATTAISELLLMQGTNRPWRDCFRALLDGTRKDTEGRPIEGMQYPDGGGITLNHTASTSIKELMTKLDFDPRVLGIEAWHSRNHFGAANPQLGKTVLVNQWDTLVSSGRRCLGFFVKDHFLTNGRGRNVLLLPSRASQTREQRERREHDAMIAYRKGQFFGSVGAYAVDDTGKIVMPYDQTTFRFSRIALRNDAAGKPVALDVAVTGGNRTLRPNIQIRFVSDSGTMKVVDAESGTYDLPTDSDGMVQCRFLRVEAFAYPSTQLGGRPLTVEDFTKMDLMDISRIHDYVGGSIITRMDPPDQAPIGSADLILSQPIRFPHP